MSYETQLNAEIYKQLDQLSEMGQAWRAEFIAHAIVSSHAEGLPDNEHTDFWRHCAYRSVREAVRRCINKRAGDERPADDRQYRIPGYDHVHAYYVVRRDDTDVGVPVSDLTDDEIDQKSALYKKMGRECFDHADELQRYKFERTRVDLFAGSAA